MGGFSVVNSPPRFVDTGQGASGRLASWMAWTADPSPLMGPESTLILRTEDNGAGSGDPHPLPLGTGGCGTWSAVLDGFSNGATSGGDNCFYINFPISIPLVDDYGTQIEDDGGGGTFDVGPGDDTTLPWNAGPYPDAVGLIDDNGVLLTNDETWPTDSSGLPGSLWSNGGVVNVIPGFTPTAPIVLTFGSVSASLLFALGAFGLTTTIPTAGSGQLYLVGDEIWVA